VWRSVGIKESKHTCVDLDSTSRAFETLSTNADTTLSMLCNNIIVYLRENMRYFGERKKYPHKDGRYVHYLTNKITLGNGKVTLIRMVDTYHK
jgi:hypothetical protein